MKNLLYKKVAKVLRPGKYGGQLVDIKKSIHQVKKIALFFSSCGTLMVRLVTVTVNFIYVL